MKTIITFPLTATVNTAAPHVSAFPLLRSQPDPEQGDEPESAREGERHVQRPEENTDVAHISLPSACNTLKQGNRRGKKVVFNNLTNVDD